MVTVNDIAGAAGVIAAAAAGMNRSARWCPLR